MGARKSAFTLLVEMGHAFLRFGSNQEGESVGCGLRAGVDKLPWPREDFFFFFFFGLQSCVLLCTTGWLQSHYSG